MSREVDLLIIWKQFNGRFRRGNMDSFVTVMSQLKELRLVRRKESRKKDEVVD